MTDLQEQTLADAQPLVSSWTACLEDYVIAAGWSAGRQMLAAASISGEIAFFMPNSDRPEIHHGSAHEFGVGSVSWHPRLPLLASGGQDGQVKIWSQGKLCSQGETRDSWIEKVAWSPDGHWLAAAAGRQIHLWTLSSDGGQLASNIVSPEHANTISDIAWQPQQSSAREAPEVAASCYGQISFWQPDALEPTRHLTWQGTPLVMAWCPDGRYLVCGEQDATLHVWALPSEREMAMSGYPEKIRQVAWDRTGRLLASGGGMDITIWDFEGQGPEGSEPVCLEAHIDSITALAFQTDGPFLASGGREGMLAVWNPLIGQDVQYVDYFEDNQISCLDWSERDNCLLAGTADGRLVLYANPTAPS